MKYGSFTESRGGVGQSSKCLEIQASAPGSCDLGVEGLGFRVSVLGFRVSGFRVSGQRLGWLMNDVVGIKGVMFTVKRTKPSSIARSSCTTLRTTMWRGCMQGVGFGEGSFGLREVRFPR